MSDVATPETLSTRQLNRATLARLDGWVAGTWTVERRAGKVTLTLSPFERLSRGAAAALADEAEALMQFTEADGATVAVAVGKPGQG